MKLSKVFHMPWDRFFAAEAPTERL